MKSSLSLLPVPPVLFLPTLEAGTRQVKTFPSGPPVTLHSLFLESISPNISRHHLPQILHSGSTYSLGDFWRDGLTSPPGSYITVCVSFAFFSVPAVIVHSKGISFASQNPSTIQLWSS